MRLQASQASAQCYAYLRAMRSIYRLANASSNMPILATISSEIAMEEAKRSERERSLIPRFPQVLVVSGVGCPSLLQAGYICFGRWALLSSFPGPLMLTVFLFLCSSSLLYLVQCMINDLPKPKTSFFHQLKNVGFTTPQENASPSSPMTLLSQSGSY